MMYGHSLTAQENRCFSEWTAQALMALVCSGAEMQRDDDYLRQILLDMEASPEWRFPGPSLVLAPSPEEVKRDYHLGLLLDGNLLTWVESRNWCRMTNAGHDFLANTRKSESWEAVKSASARFGGAGVAVMAKIAEELLMQKLRDVGILPGAR